ncbi:hypothetical protein GCM10007338_04160 [Corynebacterium pelargi]|nr:hypothetical protein GCM10007338_04160 [Corynebacterium pelargi]
MKLIDHLFGQRPATPMLIVPSSGIDDLTQAMHTIGLALASRIRQNRPEIFSPRAAKTESITLRRLKARIAGEPPMWMRGHGNLVAFDAQ